jgi:hypothetical protein
MPKYLTSPPQPADRHYGVVLGERRGGQNSIRETGYGRRETGNGVRHDRRGLLVAFHSSNGSPAPIVEPDPLSGPAAVPIQMLAGPPRKRPLRFCNGRSAARSRDQRTAASFDPLVGGGIALPFIFRLPTIGLGFVGGWLAVPSAQVTTLSDAGGPIACNRPG